MISFPGIGPSTGARLLAEVGSDRTRFATADGLKAYAGAASIIGASGKGEYVGRRFITTGSTTPATWSQAVRSRSVRGAGTAVPAVRGCRASSCEQDTLVQEVEAGSAEHLALEHLDPFDVAFRRRRSSRGASGRR
ncbi:transposase [Streptomyces coeruleoprunus]|uniref:Transposase n=2 Tax=Streptomyces coeruleoprunus TaxID=285563 RepID=A0ABV9XCE1_9ACTN